MTKKIDLKIGDRIELQKMGEDPITGRPDPDPIEPGMRGNVTYVTPIPGGETQVGVDWDNGRNLAVILPIDQIVKLYSPK